MELREMIEEGARKVGSQKELAETIGETPENLTGAKAGRRGLKDESCLILAELIDAPLGSVIAARNYALAKDEEHRKFWMPFVKSDWRRGRDSNPCAKFP